MSGRASLHFADGADKLHTVRKKFRWLATLAWTDHEAICYRFTEFYLLIVKECSDETRTIFRIESVRSPSEMDCITIEYLSGIFGLRNNVQKHLLPKHCLISKYNFRAKQTRRQMKVL